ncbi:hypothetical protein ABT297_30545 [Dactylosporangium sp. NPDC000555]|uniref:hypothetical protein n=1 Tax=Dactylosporangium sp. NPDC000555 TaxID=3154260 RepID=UPI0033308737
MSLGTRAASFGTAVLLALAVDAVVAQSASAVPSDCTISRDNVTHEYSSLCTAGTGEHQVVVQWKFVNPWLPPDVYTSRGPWAGVGSVSTTSGIPGSAVIISAAVQLR